MPVLYSTVHTHFVGYQTYLPIILHRFWAFLKQKTWIGVRMRNPLKNFRISAQGFYRSQSKLKIGTFEGVFVMRVGLCSSNGTISGTENKSFRGLVNKNRFKIIHLGCTPRKGNVFPSFSHTSHARVTNANNLWQLYYIDLLDGAMSYIYRTLHGGLPAINSLTISENNCAKINFV